MLISEPCDVLIVCSDCHLSNTIWTKYPQIKWDSFCSFEFIARYAIKQNRANSNRYGIILAGDVIDKKEVNSEVARFLRRTLDLLEEYKIPVYYIQGQHELSDSPWLSSLSDWPTYIDYIKSGDYLLFGGYKIVGLDYRPKHEIKEALDNIPETEIENLILIMHQAFSDFFGREGDISLTDLLGICSYVFSGDIHKHERVTVKGHHCLVVEGFSPGSTHIRAIDEPTRKYFYELRRSGEVKSISVPTRPIIRIDETGNISELPEMVKSTINKRQAKCDRLFSERLLPLNYINEVLLKPLIVVPSQELFDKVLALNVDDIHLYLHDRPTPDLLNLFSSKNEQINSDIEHIILETIQEFDDGSPEFQQARHVLEQTTRVAFSSNASSQDIRKTVRDTLGDII